MQVVDKGVIVRCCDPDGRQPERRRHHLEGHVEEGGGLDGLHAEPAASVFVPHAQAPSGAAAGGGESDAPRDDEAAGPGERRTGHWILSPEKVLWEWPYAEDWLREPLD